MKYGYLLSTSGGLLTFLGTLFFENTPFVKFTFLISGVLLAAIGVMLMTKSTKPIK